jgi:hypothetical protein
VRAVDLQHAGQPAGSSSHGASGKRRTVDTLTAGLTRRCRWGKLSYNISNSPSGWVTGPVGVASTDRPIS